MTGIEIVSPIANEPAGCSNVKSGVLAPKYTVATSYAVTVKGPEPGVPARCTVIVPFVPVG